MAKIEIVTSTAALTVELRKNIREEDAIEIHRYGVSLRKAIWTCYADSLISRAALVDGEIAAMWGVIGYPLGGTGIPWLLTTKLVEGNPVNFAIIYRREVRHMLRLFPKLENYVDARYTKACRVLELAGFTLDEPKPHGHKNELFRRFHMGMA